ncbi:unnamed protein product [Rotaria socialis]|uniref:RRM domain-containing protein n=1 Tax=Rotaria socialis TaxID=392032 RepID=A0A819A267_9BILA|nr:unnamed protein product [Rotaria socialis]CAF4216500.1 unnamed protein product [Rotaria socialis]
MSRDRHRQDDRTSSKSSRNHDYLIKLRGIPYSSTKDDIKKFLHPCRIDTIHLFNNRGSSSDECLVDLELEADVKDALKKSNQLMGNRYIEILQATVYEYNFFVKHKGMISWREPVIRMNGLPYTCTMGDVQNFFKDIPIARNGIYITRDMTDNALGGGYVAFISMDNAYKAMDIYDQAHIQHRYIQLSPSTYDEAKKTILNDAVLNGKRFAGESDDEDNNNNTQNRTNRSPRNSRPTSRIHRGLPAKQPPSQSITSRSRSRQRHDGSRRRSRKRSRSPVRHSSRTSIQNGEYLVKMRGMPFTVVEKDIREFFPSAIQPVHIKILYDRRTNRPNGDAHIYFNTMDQVNEAVKCDRKYMGSRYVEIYFESRRTLSSNRRRSKSKDSSHHSSRSSSKTSNHDKSRSRSESRDKTN